MTKLSKKRDFVSKNTKYRVFYKLRNEKKSRIIEKTRKYRILLLV